NVIKSKCSAAASRPERSRMGQRGTVDTNLLSQCKVASIAGQAKRDAQTEECPNLDSARTEYRLPIDVVRAYHRLTYAQVLPRIGLARHSEPCPVPALAITGA